MESKLRGIKLERTQLRRHFTRILNQAEDDLNKESTETQGLQCKFMELGDIVERLFTKDSEIGDLILNEDNIDEDAYATECDSTQEYRGKWFSFKVRCEALLEKVAHNDKSSSTTGGSQNMKLKRNFHLPKLELKKFDGDVRNWLGFWGQFKKIHEDIDIDAEDKFQYLLQSVTSTAKELIESFPPSGENYYKAVEQLKSRFAKDELIIEIYVRELLNLVLQQSSSNKTTPLYMLYDKLETQLRALETLGVTSNKYAAVLQPLVESALPEDTLRLWERHKATDRNRTHKTSETERKAYGDLQDLLDFLRTEVESEERVTIARTGFLTSPSSKIEKQIEPKRSSSSRWNKGSVPTSKSSLGLPTAATILSVDTKGQVSKSSCLFCRKESHNTQDCAGIHKLTLTERKDFIKKKGACFICLLTGHNASKCKVFVNCFFCNKKHYAVMCQELNRSKMTDSCGVNSQQSSCSGPSVTSHGTSKITHNEKDKSEILISQQKSETLLQTLIVKIRSNDKTYLARVLLDSGSQRSYITKDCIPKLGIQSTGEEIIAHSLFGGVELKQTSHNSYLVTLENIHSDFKCTVPVLDQEVICNFVPRLQSERCFSILREKNIILSDVGDNNIPDIKILLGADVIGKLLTGVVQQLDGDLTAVQTHLGWTVMGKQQITKQQQALLTLFCQEKVSVSDLWNLDIIGIRDPVDVKSRAQLEADAFQHFKETVTINSQKRCQVCLPWLQGHPELLDNRDLAEKRLLSVSTRLKASNILCDYDNVFQEWLKSGIIEKVPEESQPSPGYYLPHHAVIKESSLTTKIRPVFDASAKDRSSLNSCLEKGPNLVELIPLLIMRFRQSSIGVTADIEKAFLQISLSESDRNFLRFLWWEDYEAKRLVVYRHCRVVFGVSSSPFLLGATITHHLENVFPEYETTVDKLKNSFYVDNCVTSVDSAEELVTFIKEATLCMSLGKFNLRDWHFVPGEMNPADLPSRGWNPKVLYETRWWQGPTWLKESEDKWPNSNPSIPENEVNAEKRKTVISAVTFHESTRFTHSLIYFSKYFKIVRMVAWMYRFIFNSLPKCERITGELTIDEVTKAEISLLKRVQLEAVCDSKSKTMKNLQVFKDENGLMRIQTKLVLNNDPDDYKYPILLPSKHPVVASLILEKHQIHNHAGVQMLLVILRETFWLLKGRKTVREIISKCVVCKRFKAKHVETMFAPLPIERISDCSAFDTTGLAGPLYLKNGTKCWIVLFTCAVYRAIHLELTESLSTEAFIAALRRFIARRGRMSTIFTDNGTNFVKTNKLIKNLNWDNIYQEPTLNKIVWKFNPPSAPWWGGWWERLVRLVKELLRRNLGLASVTYEELLTLLCDCESLINQRPLTYMSEDTDSLQPLTPSMFLQPIIRCEVTDLDKIDSTCLNKRVRYVQKLREGLRERFKKEYLAMLVHRSKGHQINSNPINVGDVVLIGDDNVKRIKWPVAIILELIPGKDGIKRVARLRTGHGELTRPVQRLYPLEIGIADVNELQEAANKIKKTMKPEKERKCASSQDIIKKKLFTRKGREVKVPQKLDI